VSNNLPGTGIVRRLQAREDAPTSSGMTRGEDPLIRLGMERMSVHLHEQGNEGGFSREKATAAAHRAHRRKHD
jgi:hypothetical protein